MMYFDQIPPIPSPAILSYIFPDTFLFHLCALSVFLSIFKTLWVHLVLPYVHGYGTIYR